MPLFFKSNMSNDSKKIQKFFNNLAKQYGNSVSSLAWESDYTQGIRFSVLAGIDNLVGMKILDVGCGKADLYSYFGSENILVDYYGIDLASDLINLAKKNYPDINIIYRDFLSDGHIPEIDYALSSGIANLKTPNNMEYIESVIKKMFTIAKKGAAINMLTSYAPENKQDTGMYFYSPEQMLKFALKLTRNVILRHEYLQNDFTLYLYKQQ